MLATSHLAQRHNMIYYITVNKPYQAIVEDFEGYGIDRDKFLFLDATPYLI